MQKKKSVIEQEVDSSFAYSLLRNDLLPELLGQEEETILYWAGKHLAKKYPLASNDEICDFFQKARWGTLSVVKEKPNTIVFELVPPEPSPKHFKLEAGFLAEQFALMRERVTETFEQVKRNRVIFTVESNE
jgi:hypothetical protein